MTKAILSDQFPEYIENLRNMSFQTLPSETVECFIEYEQTHADMQCLMIEDTAFILSCCKKLAKALENDYQIVLCGEPISGKYPHNIPLNACAVGKNLIGKLDSVDPKVILFCKKRGYRMIDVRQGYTKCSCAVVSNNALITADNGIYYSLKETNIEVLKIEEGRIGLSENLNGFIGGASGYYHNRLYFTGNIRLHQDYQKIREFCNNHHTKIISLSEKPLQDIGGILFC